MKSVLLRQITTLTILYGSGIALLWWSTSWMATLGVFILLWALRVDDRFGSEGRVVEYFQRRRTKGDMIG